ncbi:MAG: hypothetical protein IJH41_06975 [Eubacterium sp.]|nr:hypothetical protein [Eubacterium sp.]
MDAETISDAFTASVVIVGVIVIGIAAIIFAIIKKKNNYDSTGVPKRVEKPEEEEGSTKKAVDPDVIKTPEDDNE